MFITLTAVGSTKTTINISTIARYHSYQDFQLKPNVTRLTFTCGNFDLYEESPAEIRNLLNKALGKSND